MSRKNKLHDAERYAVLAAVYAKDGTGISNANVGAYRTKTVKAGEYLYVSCYPLIAQMQKREQDKALEMLRHEKRIGRLMVYARHNNKQRMLRFEQLVHANFGKGDFHVTCTYGPIEYGMPNTEADYRDREQAKKDVRNYIARVKRLLKRHGCNVDEFRWIAVTVTKEYDKEAMRPFPDFHHHHLLMHGIPEELRGEVERLWPFGYCNADRLQPDDKGISAVANYIARQEGSANGSHAPGEKSYTGSRNLKKPAVTTSDSKISRRRAAQIADDVRGNAWEIFGKIYPGYRLVEQPVVQTSDFVAGGYIYAKLRIRSEGGNAYGKDQSGLVRKARNLEGEV